MKECHVIDWRFRSEIKTDRSRKQNKQRQSRLDKLGEIGNDTIARHRKIRIFKRGRFHAGTCFCAPGGRAPSNCACEVRQQIAEMVTPKDSMTAPRATCAVATSAALLLQIVHAPSSIWQITSASQRIESLLSTAKRGESRRARRANANTATAMMTARNRCAICSQIWNAV